jgi:hypothetical protein
MKLALIVSATAITLGGAYYYLQVLGSEIALFEMFPDYHYKLVVKAHREFVRETLAGKYTGIDLTDAQCTEIMQSKLDSYTK